MRSGLIILLLVMGLAPWSVAAEDRVDLERLTAECMAAANAFRAIRHEFAYKVLHTVVYHGYSGDAQHISLVEPVAMVIRWAGSDKRGQFWFLKDPTNKRSVVVSSDGEGNIKMVEIDSGANAANTFTGKMVDGIIKGVWQSPDGGVRFAFHATADRQ